MWLWIVFAVLTAIVIIVLMSPYKTRAAGAGSARSAFDLAVYRDQLAELDRDTESGLIGKAEASESSSVDRPSVRRGVAVALAAASIVLAVAGLVLVGADLIGDGGAPVANPSPVSTVPEATEVSSPQPPPHPTG